MNIYIEGLSHDMMRIVKCLGATAKRAFGRITHHADRRSGSHRPSSHRRDLRGSGREGRAEWVNVEKVIV